MWASLEESYCISVRLYKQPMNGAQVEEIRRHFGVVAEALPSDIRQIAEGHSGILHELRELGMNSETNSKRYVLLLFLPAAVIQTDTPLNRKGFTSELSLFLYSSEIPYLRMSGRH